MRERPRVCVAVLAAGVSRRMGACKMTLALPDGTMLLGRALDAALGCAARAAGLHADDGRATSRSIADATIASVEVVVVTGAHREVVSPIVARAGVCELHNPRWASGQASSVALAARYALGSGFDALLVTVADQPFVCASHLRELIERFADRHAGAARFDANARTVMGGADGSGPAAPVAWRTLQAGTGRRGNPCLFARPCLEALTLLTGDEGARSLFRAHPEMAVCDVAFDDPLLFEDVDTPDDAARVGSLLVRCAEEGRTHEI